MTGFENKLMLAKARVEEQGQGSRKARVKLFPGASEPLLPPPVALRLFTPCTSGCSLLEAVADTGFFDVSGDVFLHAPACSIFDEFRDYQQSGKVHCSKVKSISGGSRRGTHNRMLGN